MQGLTFLPAPPGAHPNPTRTLLTNMYQQGVISVPAFTLFLVNPSNPVPLPGTQTPGKIKPPVVTSICSPPPSYRTTSWGFWGKLPLH